MTSTSWGHGSTRVGVAVPDGWKCPGCGAKPTRSKGNAGGECERADGSIVCPGCARALWAEEQGA